MSLAQSYTAEIQSALKKISSVLKNLTVINNDGVVNVKQANVAFHKNIPSNKDEGIKMANGFPVFSVDSIRTNSGKVFLINNLVRADGMTSIKIDGISYPFPKLHTGKVNMVSLI